MSSNKSKSEYLLFVAYDLVQDRGDFFRNHNITGIDLEKSWVI